MTDASVAVVHKKIRLVTGKNAWPHVFRLCWDGNVDVVESLVAKGEGVKARSKVHEDESVSLPLEKRLATAHK